MSDKIIMNVKPGRVRAIYSDALVGVFAGQVPRRATKLEPVPTGPYAGRWFVDCSPLGAQYQFCLLPTYATHGEAVEAEHAWLVENWIKPCEQDRIPQTG